MINSKLRRLYLSLKKGKNMKLLLKNGTVLDYASKTNEKLDVLVEDRKNYKNRKKYRDRRR